MTSNYYYNYNFLLVLFDHGRSAGRATRYHPVRLQNTRSRQDKQPGLGLSLSLRTHSNQRVTADLIASYDRAREEPKTRLIRASRPTRDHTRCVCRLMRTRRARHRFLAPHQGRCMTCSLCIQDAQSLVRYRAGDSQCRVGAVTLATSIARSANPQNGRARHQLLSPASELDFAVLSSVRRSLSLSQSSFSSFAPPRSPVSSCGKLSRADRLCSWRQPREGRPRVPRDGSS